MPVALVVSAIGLALTGGVHCSAMCGGLLINTLQTPRQRMVFYAARLMSYSVAGAVIGYGSERWYLYAHMQNLKALHAAWVMAQLLMGVLALWMMMTGRLPSDRWRGALTTSRPIAFMRPTNKQHGWYGALTMGLFWSAVPCGLLSAALLLSYMAGTAAGGLLVMMVFGLVTTLFLDAASHVRKLLHQMNIRIDERGWVRLNGCVIALSLVASIVWRHNALWCVSV